MKGLLFCLFLLLVTCSVAFSQVQLDDLKLENGIFILDDQPYSGTAIRQYSGDYKSTRQNGTWNFKDGKLHGKVENRLGVFHYTDGKRDGICHLYSEFNTTPIAREQCWKEGIIMEDQLKVTDTFRIKWGQRKFYSPAKIPVGDMCGGYKRKSTRLFNQDNPDGYYMISKKNKHTGKMSYESGVFMGGKKQGKWKIQNSALTWDEEFFFLSGTVYFHKQYSKEERRLFRAVSFLADDHYGYFQFTSNGREVFKL